jgi:hypothetical protein
MVSERDLKKPFAQSRRTCWGSRGHSKTLLTLAHLSLGLDSQFDKVLKTATSVATVATVDNCTNPRRQFLPLSEG